MRKKILSFLLLGCMIVGLFGIEVFAAEPTTWDPNYKAETVNLSNNNLTANTGPVMLKFVRATEPKYSGKWYWEVTLDSGNTAMYIGIINSEANNAQLNDSWRSYYPYGGSLSSWDIRYASDLKKAKNGDTIGLALDIENGTLAFYINGVSLTTQYEGIDEKGLGLYPMIAGGSTGNPCVTTTNFGATPFKYDIPEGFLPYNSDGQTTTSSALAVLLEVDEAVQLSVTDDLSDNTKLTWTSSNNEVATVDANGKVTALKEGLTQIWAKNADDTFKEYINVRVVAKGKADELRLAVDLKVGKSQALYLNDDVENITWSSADETIATVSSTGKITAVAKGLVIVNATYNGKTEMIYVRVS